MTERARSRPNGADGRRCGPRRRALAGPAARRPALRPRLLRDGDTRNVVDAYRYWTREAIVADIDTRRHPLHVAIENFGNDANIGAVVRTANAFAVDTVHIVGRRRWNRRGAMVTDRYQRLRHHDTTAELLAFAAGRRADRRRRRQRARRGATRADRAAARLPAGVRPGGPRHHRRRQRGRRADGVDRPVRVDPQHQRRRRGRHRHARLDQATRRHIPGLVGQDLRHGSGMGQPGGQRGSRRRQAASETALGAARHPARRGRPGRRRGRTGSSAPGTTGGRRICWTAWSTRSCATRNPTGETKIKRQIRSHRLRNNGSWVNDYYDDMAWLALALERAGRLAGVEQPARAARSCPTSSSTRGCPRTAAASRGASRTSSSTPRPTGRRGSSWPATATGCGAPSRWRTGSTRP